MIFSELRPGAGDILFMISGAGGAAEEVAGLAAALDGDTRVIALVPLPAPDAAEAETTVEAMATATVALMRSHQPHGPYRLLGYSLGGLVALETSRLLKEAGEVVGFLGLVDAPFDERYWPGALFVRASVRRTALHVRELFGKPPAQAWRELRGRIGRLARRVRGRFNPAGEGTREGMTVEEANFAALAQWRPKVFEGQTVLFIAEQTDFGCDLADLWRPWLPDMEVRRIPGNHLELVQDPGGIARLARAVSDALGAADAPRLHVLVAATFGWWGAARLAVELNASGCIVEAVGPKGSTLHCVSAVKRSYVLGRMDPVASLRKAIESSGADMIIPYDDRTRQVMHRIHAGADPATEAGAQLRRRLERSLGPAELYCDLYSRVAIMDIAAECGVRCPQTAAVESVDDVMQWLTAHPGPAVLKTDGSWGGRETWVVHSADDVRKAWRRLSRPTTVPRCVKRLLIEGDPWPLRARLTGHRPRLSIQSYVEGVPGNVAAACLDGRLLGAVQAEVVCCQGQTGPSTLLRVIDHPEMRAAATAMVDRLRLSGLVGLDFVLENGTGRAHLLEVNPRATPTSHLIAADGTDLLAALRAALGHAGPAPRAAAYPADRLVALFPQEMRRDPTGESLATAYHDVPWHAPDLVAQTLDDLRSLRSSDVHRELLRLAQPASRIIANAPAAVPHADHT